MVVTGWYKCALVRVLHLQKIIIKTFTVTVGNSNRKTDKFFHSAFVGCSHIGTFKVLLSNIANIRSTDNVL